MARIRSIKPEFWLDEEIASWPPVTRLAYIALWNEADDEGRLRANPAFLKNRIFPYEPKVDIAAVLAPIAQSGKLVVYMVGAQTYGFLPRFADHQVINHPSKSKLPGPEEASSNPPVASGNVPVALLDSSRNDPAGKEGKGTGNRERKGIGSSADERFSIFWGSYPRKVGKGAALARWGKLSDSDRAFAVAAVAGFANAWSCRPREDHQFCPHPATWLSERRWEDDPGEWTGADPENAETLKRKEAADRLDAYRATLKAEADAEIREMREARAARKAKEAASAGA